MIREEPKQVREEPKTKIEEPKKRVEIKSAECNDFNNLLSTAFSDAVLPSKSPLPQDDPFNYFNSKHYIKMFIVASVAFVFVLSLFD